MPKHWKIVTFVWAVLTFLLVTAYVAVRIRLRDYSQQISEASYNEMLALRDDPWLHGFERLEMALGFWILLAAALTIASLTIGKVLGESSRERKRPE